MSSDDAHDAVFKALGDSRRRAVLDLLKVRPMTTGELVEHFPELDRTTVMQHLGVLEKAGLVIPKKEGRQRWNYFNPLPIQEIHERYISRYAQGAVQLLARLKADLEE
ncbi:winged helix-turn-helix transcriptional regulator [Pyxidicoccus parkwayensis]|uniref:Winged helix-turn-helix transcriptional regulator n=1 Tax=Pyxidicoccus parkwayensis TaxID=2813578 RepID=A0ABX7NS36_9BACT|nr:helix-turn-helix domain-containing protein [Pyxidicoccus parkwaysis]QSQ21701.1 winged helix-turn-helix transcriptional regulator [Pyxidicoccus parkwaysis]